MKKILQKIIAETGFCSRRSAETMIKKGQVKLNGVLAVPGDMAEEGDKITVAGRLIGSPKSKVYIKMNKPKGYTCTTREFKNEQNIYELSDSIPRGVFPVGRLDKDSRGLLFLTNDGDLSLKLSHPRFAHEKIYEVRVPSDVPDLSVEKAKAAFLKGINLGQEEGIAKAKKVKYLQNGLFEITLDEGKKRQIRRMFADVKLKVLDLKRIKFAGLELGNLPEGKWGYLNKKELDDFKKLK
jgi:pseudouridine synthase